jgi:hypothetical protein
MKFVRPLYRALHESEMGRDLAVDAFLKNKDFYHPICAKMIASDLKLTVAKPNDDVVDSSSDSYWKMAVLVGAVAVAATFIFSRRK